MSELRGRLLLEGALVPGRVSFDAGRITSVEADQRGNPDPSEGELPIVAPGLVDLHIHGFAGAQPLDDLAGMARALAGVGTTGFCPTLFPGDPKKLGRECERVWASVRSEAPLGARVLGFHLEGPFVNPEARGALPEDGLVDPSPAALRDLLGPATGDGRGIRTMTLAPELEGSPALVEELVRSGVRVSLGHSLAGSREAGDAARKGASGATHLFNAMGGFHHRRAGLVGFALSQDALCAEIIGDLVHVGREAMELALRARGARGLALVSDALHGAGTGCDVFHSHGSKCVVRDGAIWIDDPETGDARLTGAVLTQLDAVRGLVGRGVLGVEEALTMASETPARALGMEDDLGRLVRGARADLLVLGGPDLELLEVRIAGQPVPPTRAVRPGEGPAPGKGASRR